MNHPVIAPKKLIEVALPLDNINAACAREKSIRHGHPSTLHLWWARRPLAAARAVLFAQLVNDPSWKYTDEELKKPQVKGAITKKRSELFALISELVLWENTNSEPVLARARKEIRASWLETCAANKDHPEAKTLFDPKSLPAFHDPFAGGGAIPLEAQRLGLEAHASDLNPVAVLINKAMIEIPPKFAGRAPVGPVPKSEKQTKVKAADDWSGARGLAEDVRRYGAWMREEAEKRIGHLYPKVAVTKAMAKDRADLAPLVGQELTVIAWLWARTVKSPNPAFADVDVPLASSFVLSSKPGKESWVEVIVEKKTYRFEIRKGTPPEGAVNGTKLGRGANFRCVMSNVPITPDYVKSEGSAGRMGTRMMAVVAEGMRTRIYLPPLSTVEAVAKTAIPTWRPNTELPDDPRNFWTLAYGLRRFSDLFTARQLVALTTFSELVTEAIEKCRSDALEAGMQNDNDGLNVGGKEARAYAEAVAMYLGFSVSKATDRNSSLCFWENAMDRLRGTFGRQALPMVWDYAETNPFAGAGGDIRGTAFSLAEVLDKFVPSERAGFVQQSDAQSQRISQGKVVSTDPPYYDNIGYADLSDFFYVWLQKSLKPIFPDLFATLAVPKAEELVATPYRHGGKKEAEVFFLNGMTQAIHNIAVHAQPGFPVTIYYAFKQADTKSEAGETSSTGWETFLEAVLQAGFGITGTWPMRTELTVALKKRSNVLASSIVLVCRKRPSNAASVSRKDFLRQLQRTLPAALAEMTADPSAAVAPVDLAQAAIGPGMAIFSRYSAVLEADGASMSVHSALVHINKTIDDYFSEAEGELDADTRFCIGWFQQYGFEPGAFGEADVLARAKGTAVDGVAEAGVLHATKGKVRLLRTKEYPKKWDPTEDARVPVWEACHQMCRALSESENAAGALLARMPEKQDAIRQLAYRLYTICERQKWAEEARAYNELVSSWPAIVGESHKTGHKGTQLGLSGLGDEVEPEGPKRRG
jgi:putative DNA methylase